MDPYQEQIKFRDSFVAKYRNEFTMALMRQITPVLEQIRLGVDPMGIAERIAQYMDEKAVKKVYMKLYPDVGAKSAMVNTEIINEQLRGKSMTRKRDNTFEELYQRWLRNYTDTVGEERIISVTNTSRERAYRMIYSAVDQTLAAGLSPAEAQESILETVRKEWTRASVFRAAAIARTEVYTAYSVANHLSAQSYITPLKKVWLHGFQSGKDRPGHVQLSGKGVGRDAMFENPVTGVKMLYPHADNLPAAEVVNCRCSVKYEPK